MFNQQQQPTKPAFKFVIKSKIDTSNTLPDPLQKEDGTLNSDASALDDRKRKRPLSEAPVTKRKVSNCVLGHHLKILIASNLDSLAINEMEQEKGRA